MIKNELQLARKLKETLTSDFRDVFDNINLASSAFYPYWEKWFGEPVFSPQPQIDLLMVDTDLHLLGVELKYFRKKPNGDINHPFYAGIDQALALLRFGFWVVSLWHFFDRELDAEDYRRLYSNCFSLVNFLDLPINYRAYRIIDDVDKLYLVELYPNTEAKIEALPSAYGRDNPYELHLNAQRLQDTLRSVLKIPQPR